MILRYRELYTLAFVDTSVYIFKCLNLLFSVLWFYATTLDFHFHFQEKPKRIVVLTFDIRNGG